MRILTKAILLAGIFIISSCGDDQSERAGQQKQHAKEEQAAPKVVTPVTSAETETTITPNADASSTIPQWAILEQNVYYYPETKMTGEKSVNSPSTIPQWAVLEQNVYFYPEIETSGMTDKAVDMVKDAAQDYVQENQDKLIETVKEKASEMVK